MRPSPTASSLLLASVALLFTVGCQRAMLESSAVDKFPSADDELEFIDAVEAEKVVTNNDALHALFLISLRADPATDYAGRVAAAKERGWLGAAFDEPANESAEIGWMARAACMEGGIKGGLTMQVFGPVPRYATKELVFMGVLPPRSENQSLSGSAFIDFLNRLDRIGKFQRLPIPESPAVPESGPPGVPGEEATEDPGPTQVEDPLPEAGRTAPDSPASTAP